MEHQYSQTGRLLRSEIATLIGIMAKDHIDYILPNPQTLQLYIDESERLLDDLHVCLTNPWRIAIKDLLETSTPSRTSPFGSADALREPIFYSGESAYNFQYQELSIKKYSADNDWLKANFGFSIDEAVEISRKISDIQMNKLESARNSLQSTHPDRWTFLPSFVFSVDEILNATKFDRFIIESFIQAFAIDSTMTNSSFLTLSDFNETNARPIIKLSDTEFVLLQHYSLVESLYESPFFWMASDSLYAPRAFKNRGAFVEEFLADRFKSVFGISNLFQNVTIKRGNKIVTDADLLVIFGKKAIILQAKSKRLTIEARKGNDFQIKDDFKKAILDAYDQCILCAESLLDENFKYYAPNEQELQINTIPTKIFLICAVADHYPALSAQSGQFLKVKCTPTIQPPIITDVFFLDALTEILDSPLHFINYLELRSKFHELLLVNQEIAILGYHLKHNLWLDEKYNFVNLGDDFSSTVDIAMHARRLGVPGDKIPKGILTRFIGTPIGRLISAIEAIGTPDLIELGMFFLQLGPTMAKHINKGIEKLVHAATRDSNSHDVSVPLKSLGFGFTVHVNSHSESIARSRLSIHCNIKKYEMRVNTWFGLLLSPGEGEIRFALAIEEKWAPSPKMEQQLEKWPKKAMIPIEKLSSGSIRLKIGRNDLCPCGSGLKYKKCCLHKL